MHWMFCVYNPGSVTAGKDESTGFGQSTRLIMYIAISHPTSCANGGVRPCGALQRSS